MQRLLVAVLAVMCIQQAAGKAIPSFAGPFIAFVEKLVVCERNDGRDFKNDLNVKISHFNPLKPFEPQIWNGNFTNPEDVTDNSKVRVRMDVRNNNQWKENAFIFNFPKDGCSNAKQHMPVDFLRFFAKGPKCRIPKGFQKVNNVPIDVKFPHFPVIPYGTYRFWVNVTGLPNDMFICLLLEGTAIPKPQ